MAAPRKSKQTAPAVSPLAAMVDELGALDRELAPLAPKTSRSESLRKAIRAHFDQAPAAENQTADGIRFQVLLGARENVSSVDVAKLAGIIGTKETLAIVGCTLKALKQYPEAAAAVVSYSPTGTRPLTIVEKGSAA